MLLLNSVSQSVHGITKLVPQARMLRVLTLLSIKNTSKGPRALILSGSEMSVKALIIYLFNMVYLWLHCLLSKCLSFLFCLYPFYQPSIPSNLPSIFLKYISDHAACSLKKKKKKQRTNPSFSVWRVSLACVWPRTPPTSPASALCLSNAQAAKDSTISRSTRALCLVASFSAWNVLPNPLNEVQRKRSLFCGIIVTVLSCTFPCFSLNKWLLPQYPHRKYQMKKKLLNIYYLNKLVLRIQNWNKSSPSLMELRIHLGRSKSRSSTIGQWVNCVIDDLPGGGWRNWILKDKGHRCWSYI